MNKKLLIIIIAVVIVIILAFLFLNHHGGKLSKLPGSQTNTLIWNTTNSSTTAVHMVYTNSTTVKTTSYTTSVATAVLVLRNDTYFLTILANEIPAKAYLYYLSNDSMSLFNTFNITSNVTLLPLIDHNGLPFSPGKYNLVVNGTGITLNFGFTLNAYTGDIIYTNGSYSLIVLPQPPLKIIIDNITTYVLSSTSGTYNGVILVKGYIPPTTSIEIYNGVQWIKVRVVYVPRMVYLPYSEVLVKSS
ncbi:hypothetical protein [Stygiolobus sp. RP850M]|uniref:hypothetical protein n=1 Tax=Stygiolobus sp. RP850M TaxID=3133137 RepID=UPI00307D2F2A